MAYTKNAHHAANNVDVPTPLYLCTYKDLVCRLVGLLENVKSETENYALRLRHWVSCKVNFCTQTLTHAAVHTHLCINFRLGTFSLAFLFVFVALHFSRCGRSGKSQIEESCSARLPKIEFSLWPFLMCAILFPPRSHIQPQPQNAPVHFFCFNRPIYTVVARWFVLMKWKFSMIGCVQSRENRFPWRNQCFFASSTTLKRLMQSTRIAINRTQQPMTMFI